MNIWRVIIAIVLAAGIIQPTLALGPSVSWFETSPDGEFVTQTIELKAPSTFKITFSYCNPQICSGPDDPLRDCHAGFWIPNLPDGEIPLTLNVQPLPNATVEKIFLKTRSPIGIPSHYGSYKSGSSNQDWNAGILGSAPGISPNGSVSLAFAHPLPDSVRKAFKPGGVCGVTEDVAKQYQNQTFDNFYNSTIKVAIIWRLNKLNSVINTSQTITVNGAEQKISASYGSFTPTLTAPDSVIQNVLLSTKPSNSTQGLSQQEIISAFNREGYQFNRQTDLGRITQKLTDGESAVAWVTTRNDSSVRSGAVLVNSYNSQTDKFQVVNISTGRSTWIPYNTFMNQNPSFNFVVKRE